MNDSTPKRQISTASNENNSPLTPFTNIIRTNSNLNKQKSISITSISSNVSENSSGGCNSDSPYQNFLIRRVSNKSSLYQKSLTKINHSPDDYNVLAAKTNNNGSIDNFRKLSLRGTNLFQDRTNTSNDVINKQSKIPIFNLKECTQEIENEDKENNYYNYEHHKLIKHSLEIEAKCRNLIGDRSSELILPTLFRNIKHPDLNCITPETVNSLLHSFYKKFWF
jgi:hypothetical protein